MKKKFRKLKGNLIKKFMIFIKKLKYIKLFKANLFCVLKL